MRYNPGKYHRRSIRLKGYDYSALGAYFITICIYYRECFLGKVVDCEMVLNQFGQLVWSHWQNLTHHHPRLQLDALVVMPNHVHGILILQDYQPNRHPLETGLADPISALQHISPTKTILSKDVAPHQHPSISEIIRGFKTFSARRINQI